MKLLTIKKNKVQSLGVKTARGIIDIEKALVNHPNEHISANVTEVIKGGQETVSELQKYIDSLPKEEQSYLIQENEVAWGSPVPKPNKIICVGLNYRKHADETGSPYPETPILFPKYHNALAAHQDEIVIPKVTNKLDYEVELGIVIGKKAKNISKEEALDHVFGYVTANDLSARDLQFVSSQWLLGKSCDGFSPVGPYVVTSDEVGNPNNLKLKTYVNGEERQNSNTADMIFYCDEIISYISDYMTLIPGDIILTGTPEGVIFGYPEEKQVYLQSGDEVTVEIEKVGRLTNKFVEDK